MTVGMNSELFGCRTLIFYYTKERKKKKNHKKEAKNDFFITFHAPHVRYIMIRHKCRHE